MSSFYKSNLMDKFDSPLIPLEKDLQKDEDIEKEKSVVENPKIPLILVEYPYKAKIDNSHKSIFFLGFIFGIYWLCTLSYDRRLDGREQIIPERFLDPCNVTNVMPLNEIEKIKYKIYAIGNEKQSINDLVGYGMPESANKYLTQKLANLTETSTNLNQQLTEQNQIRFKCFKENLEEKRQKESIHGTFKERANGIYVYLAVFTALLLISFYYISKARKCDLSDEQKRACDGAFRFSRNVIICHICYVLLFMIIFPYFVQRSFEHGLKKFPHNLFLSL